MYVKFKSSNICNNNLISSSDLLQTIISTNCNDYAIWLYKAIKIDVRSVGFVCKGSRIYFIKYSNSIGSYVKKEYEIISELYNKYPAFSSTTIPKTNILGSMLIQEYVREPAFPKYVYCNFELESIIKRIAKTICKFHILTSDPQYNLPYFGQIHGDFKPSNIFVSTTRIQIVDWEHSVKGQNQLYDLYHFIWYLKSEKGESLLTSPQGSNKCLSKIFISEYFQCRGLSSDFFYNHVDEYINFIAERKKRLYIKNEL